MTQRQGSSIHYEELNSPTQPGIWRETIRRWVDTNGDGVNEVDETMIEQGTIAPRPRPLTPPPERVTRTGNTGAIGSPPYPSLTWRPRC